ncbi:PTS glucose transporter subunit IIA [Desemzia sp. RIT 804]|uniref:PTS sugar transporter subunit IIA n=1 Tax=Desemzia sp. RIT 804 TaxID=2810209 RepID=UPI00351C69D9
MQANNSNHVYEDQTQDKFQLVTVADGEIIRLEEVPDPVFSEKMVGEGFAVIPTTEEVVAPISGKLYQVADNLHAYVIETKEGVEVLVHIGINTISLHGKGFQTELKTGMSVTKGDRLAIFDRSYLEEKDISLVIPVVVIKGLDDETTATMNYVKNGIAGDTIAMCTFKED